MTSRASAPSQVSDFSTPASLSSLAAGLTGQRAGMARGKAEVREGHPRWPGCGPQQTDSFHPSALSPPATALSPDRDLPPADSSWALARPVVCVCGGGAAACVFSEPPETE